MLKQLLLVMVAFAAGVASADEYGDLLPEVAQVWPRQFLETQNRPSTLADETVYKELENKERTKGRTK